MGVPTLGVHVPQVRQTFMQKYLPLPTCQLFTFPLLIRARPRVPRVLRREADGVRLDPRAFHGAEEVKGQRPVAGADRRTVAEHGGTALGFRV